MKIISFSFDKISIEKKPKKIPTDLKITSNIDIDDITQTKADIFKTKDELIIVSFGYGLDYSPEFAKIEFKGKMILSLEPKLAKKAIKEWKSKKLLPEVQLAVFNTIISKTSVKALELEDTLNLPYHIQMPSLKPSEEKK